MSCRGTNSVTLTMIDRWGTDIGTGKAQLLRWQLDVEQEVQSLREGRG